MIICGIDPGKNGAVCFLDTEKKQIISAYSLPTSSYFFGEAQIIDFSELSDIFSYNMPQLFALELVRGWSGKGAAGMFNFGQTYGLIKAAIISHARSNGLDLYNGAIELINPLTWKAFFGLKGQGKGASIEKVQKMIIEGTITGDIYDFKLKKDHDKAEAVLLALYAAVKKGELNQ